MADNNPYFTKAKDMAVWGEMPIKSIIILIISLIKDGSSFGSKIQNLLAFFRFGLVHAAVAGNRLLFSAAVRASCQ